MGYSIEKWQTQKRKTAPPSAFHLNLKHPAAWRELFGELLKYKFLGCQGMQVYEGLEWKSPIFYSVVNLFIAFVER